MVAVCASIAAGTGKAGVADLAVKELQPWVRNEPLIMVEILIRKFEGHRTSQRCCVCMLAWRWQLQQMPFRPTVIRVSTWHSIIRIQSNQVKYATFHFSHHKVMLLVIGDKWPKEEVVVQGEEQE